MLGLFGVYQRFISRFQIIAEPLRRLLKKKNISFGWTEEQTKAFKQLKQSLANLLLLKQPEFTTQQFELHVDGAATAVIGVILCQRYNGHPCPLSFASRALTVHEQMFTSKKPGKFSFERLLVTEVLQSCC